MKVFLSVVAVVLIFGMVPALAQTHIYRSLQPGKTAAIGTSSGTLTISGSTATFSVEQPDSVGVGDAIQYDSDGNSSIDAICFIHGRTSGQEYTVKTAAGAAPTAVAGDEDWDIFRAYLSLADFISGTENSGINASVRNVDSGLKDFITNTQVWNVACYPGIDSSSAVFAAWNTNSTYRLNIFTPNLASQVGRSMRHRGVWSNYYYNMNPIVGSDYAIKNISTTYAMTVSGIQIYMRPNSYAVGGITDASSGSVTSRDLIVENCIIKGNATLAAANFYGVARSSGNGGSFRVFNNIIYDFTAGNGRGIRNGGNSLGDMQIWNNTVVNCDIGIYDEAGETWAYSNIVQDCSDGFSGTFDSGTSYNVSDLASDVPGTNGLNEISLTFRDAENDDYHLSDGDAVLVGAGYDASSIFTIDIDGETRETWYRGADEWFESDSGPGAEVFFLRRRLK